MSVGGTIPNALLDTDRGYLEEDAAGQRRARALRRTRRLVFAEDLPR